MEFQKIEGSAYDYVLSNPPYGVNVNGQDYEYLSFAHKELDQSKSTLAKVKTEILFCEFVCQHVKPKGLVGLLVPHGVTNNESYSPHRKYLMDNMRIWLSLSVPPHAFYFSGTNVSTAFLCFQKWESEKERLEKQEADYKIFMAIAENIGFDSRGRKAKNDLPEIVKEFTRAKKEF